MRAKEFITERDNAPRHAKAAMNNMLVLPDMDMYYEYYRFMSMVAGEPDVKVDGPADTFRDMPAAMAYTDEEQQMILNSLKRMGKKAKFVSGKGSAELPEVNTKSPVPQNSGMRKKKRG
jgi:hypothetical protein